MNDKEKIRALLVDDEFLALNLLKNFIARLTDIEVVAQTKSPIEAVDILQNQHIDLLFLDIRMKSLDGVKLLRTIPNPPVTIFTTAFSEYASTAFDLNAADYLLKPFSFERFLQAVNKAKYQLRRSIHVQQLEGKLSNISTAEEHITVKVDRTYLKIPLSNILFIEGMQEYIKIVCDDGKSHVTLESLKNMETFLPKKQFIRTHKSYIVAKAHVQQFKENMLEIQSYKIPVSRSRKQDIINNVFPK